MAVSKYPLNTNNDGNIFSSICMHIFENFLMCHAIRPINLHCFIITVVPACSCLSIGLEWQLKFMTTCNKIFHNCSKLSFTDMDIAINIWYNFHSNYFYFSNFLNKN